MNARPLLTSGGPNAIQTSCMDVRAIGYYVWNFVLGVLGFPSISTKLVLVFLQLIIPRIVINKSTPLFN